MRTAHTISALFMLTLAACSGPATGDGDTGGRDAASVDAGADARADHADGSSRNDGAVGDVGAERDSHVPVPTNCMTDADCDDANPRTDDTCLTLGAEEGHCVYHECSTDADCDDGDGTTYDTCGIDPADGVSFRCNVEASPFRCHSDADCIPLLTCESASCNAVGYCEHTWTEGCGYQEYRIPDCDPGTVIGARCCEGPTCQGRCIPRGEPADCPTVVGCGAIPGGPDRFVEVTPAAPECSPSACPASPPAYGDACVDEGLRCDYDPGRIFLEDAGSAPYPLASEPYCRCVDGTFRCVGNWCPPTPPAHLSPASPPTWAQYQTTRCEYRHLECRSLLNDARELVWHCMSPYGCVPMPSDGDACVPGFAGYSCSYQRDSPMQPADAYNGRCSCGDDWRWHCSESWASECPASQPAPTDTCVASTGNQQCTYFEDDGHLYCHCTRLGDWQCD